jgi:hypothetical protein
MRDKAVKKIGADFKAERNSERSDVGRRVGHARKREFDDRGIIE